LYIETKTLSFCGYSQKKQSPISHFTQILQEICGIGPEQGYKMQEKNQNLSGSKHPQIRAAFYLRG
jgi:hypothetical protein